MKNFINRIYLWLSGRDFFIKPDVIINYRFFGGSYGGWPIIEELLEVNEPSVIYSFGVGEDVSFDLELIEKHHVRVYAFDPTPKSISYVSQNVDNNMFIMHEFGLYSKDGSVKFFEPKDSNNVSHSVYSKGSGYVKVEMKRLQTIMRELEHSSIDVLKMDIEGSEYRVIDDMIESEIFPKQLLIEFHHRFKNIKAKKTKKYIEVLKKNNYQLFYVSNNGTDFGFLHVNK